ncbi:MAG: cytochrome c oxidase assembly factor Coa1 family protein [Planctomycetota bacterium]
MTSAVPAQSTRTRWYHDRGTSLAVAVIILVVISAVGLTLGALINLYLTKRSEPYQQAVATLQQHPEALKRLGGGIEPSTMVMGEIDDAAGVADFVFEATGGSGAAGVRARVEKTDSGWVVTYMDLGLGGAETGQTIAIIGDTPPGQ